MGHLGRTGVVCSVLAMLLMPSVAWAGPPYGSHSNDTPAPCAAGTTDCPTGDAFFDPPAGLAALADGAVVGHRTSALAPGGPQTKETTLLTYRSSDTFGAAVLGSATVLTSPNPYSGTGTRPLVAYQFPEDSLGRQCAPSYSLTKLGTDASVNGGELSQLLGAGYDVVVPDAEGAAEQFIAGRQEGHAVLDGIRAAESYLNLTPAATRVALMGYSGGAHSTGWASELAAGYAPDLDIVGAVEGGVPADEEVAAKFNDGLETFGLVLFAAIGLDRAYPDAGLYGDLNADGRAAYAAASTQCVQGVASVAFKTLDDYTTTPDVIDTPTFQAVLADNKLGQVAPGFPILNFHSTTDEILPYAQDKRLVDYYCAHGVAVDHLTATTEHFSGEAVMDAAAFPFLRDRFDGAAATNTCALTDAEPTPPIVYPTHLTAPASLPEAPLAVLLPLTAAAAFVLKRRFRRA